MTPYEKLAAILAAVQTDPGNRGLARDPHDNLFTATKGDFQAACSSIANETEPRLLVATGFFISTAQPPTHETDGPLGAVFLVRALLPLGVSIHIWAEPELQLPIKCVCPDSKNRLLIRQLPPDVPEAEWLLHRSTAGFATTHYLALERVGPGNDGRCRSMRGVDVSNFTRPAHLLFQNTRRAHPNAVTIGIGDGGNEIGMGKIPHETIVKNIPNGDLIHCRVPTDHLIVAGVSNWGAYALAAGVYVLRGVKPPADLFDPDREREILEVMVREGPLVDGVTGKQAATVDGLTWDEYVKPLIRIREILES
ncbi:MAG: DUF4392 domain-containing protein [Planctomycetes bacterium]|nr:DUF4392 domain-containing protein [Planctomycetota bacterium]